MKLIHMANQLGMSEKCEEKGAMFSSPTEEYISKTCGDAQSQAGVLGDIPVSLCAIVISMLRGTYI